MSVWAGFDKLRKGRIHIFCMRCRRPMSNVHREPYDPPRAELVQTFCPRCSDGCKEIPEVYLNSRGRVMRDRAGDRL